MNENKRGTLLVLAFLGLLAALAFALSEQPQTICPDGQCPVSPDGLRRMAVDRSSTPVGYSESVVLDLPPELRQKNWGGGSCVHASNVTLLRWQGQDDLADWWRNEYRGGEHADRLTKRLEAAGLRYAFTMQGDVAFLEWCCRTRRGAGIFYKPSHSINLVGLDAEHAYLLDNNATNYPERTGEYERVPRDTFIRNWQRQYGGFAWTLVYSPPPPIPHIATREESCKLQLATQP